MCEWYIWTKEIKSLEGRPLCQPAHCWLNWSRGWSDGAN